MLALPRLIDRRSEISPSESGSAAAISSALTRAVDGLKPNRRAMPAHASTKRSSAADRP